MSLLGTDIQAWGTSLELRPGECRLRKVGLCPTREEGSSVARREDRQPVLGLISVVLFPRP